ncbi:MAG: hypothetical protein OXF25_10865 [Cyanobacteria bacterium MAG CAR3_bin_5]|nr:hypothetical protein [Cyanobacteria bacterium MAG CAR3_bin_5]
MNSALPSLQAKASALAWTAAPLAALLTSPPLLMGRRLRKSRTSVSASMH